MTTTAPAPAPTQIVQYLTTCRDCLVDIRNEEKKRTAALSLNIALANELLRKIVAWQASQTDNKVTR